MTVCSGASRLMLGMGTSLAPIRPYQVRGSPRLAAVRLEPAVAKDAAYPWGAKPGRAGRARNAR